MPPSRLLSDEQRTKRSSGAPRKASARASVPPTLAAKASDAAPGRLQSIIGGPAAPAAGVIPWAAPKRSPARRRAPRLAARSGAAGGRAGVPAPRAPPEGG